MGSSGKKKTTMAKLARENRLRERRLNKQARKDARKQASSEASSDHLDVQDSPLEGPQESPVEGLQESPLEGLQESPLGGREEGPLEGREAEATSPDPAPVALAPAVPPDSAVDHEAAPDEASAGSTVQGQAIALAPVGGDDPLRDGA